MEIHTHQQDTGEYRCVIFTRGANGVLSVHDVLEHANDLRFLAACVAERYGAGNPAVAVYFPSPERSTEVELVYGDAMSLAEVIEAEFEGRDGREAACTEYRAHVEHLLTKEYGPIYAEGP